MMTKAKIRFNLGRGKNYMKWKIECAEGTFYLSPEEVNLRMVNARLRNHRGVANKINEGGNKTVCSWILCDEVEILEPAFEFNPSNAWVTQVRYNPRINPFWMDEDGNNIDKSTHEVLITSNRKIYRPLNRKINLSL